MRNAFAMLAVLACWTGSGLATAAHAQSPFDGVYRGEPTSGNGCSLFTPVLRVAGGVARMRLNPLITFEGEIGSGGNLDAPAGHSRLTGKFADGKFQGSAASGRCQYPLALQK